MPTALPRSTEDDPRWAKVLARDAGCDGRFVYSVATTGVYCRPSCPSRAAKARNVRFHADAAAAERAGFRACLRCAPDAASRAEVEAERIAAACRTIADAQTPPSLAQLAQAAQMSPHHFHRRFKAVTGLTPAVYARGVRAERVRKALGSEATVTAAAYEAGFNSSGRFHAAADAALGMTPTAFQRGGAGETIRYAVADCRLGSVLAAQSGRGICAVLLGDDPASLVADLARRFPRAELLAADVTFGAWMEQVVALVDGERAAETLPLDIRGAAFQQRVWRALGDIPAGATLSYAQVAERIGAPRAARAVAGACAANPLAVVIPCHRVVRSDGAPGGYRWGLARKRALLAREAVRPGATTA